LLFTAFNNYKESKPYRNPISTLYLQQWAEEKAQRIENECMMKSLDEIDQEIDSIDHSSFY
jgi:hypothetical protein